MHERLRQQLEDCFNDAVESLDEFPEPLRSLLYKVSAAYHEADKVGLLYDGSLEARDTGQRQLDAIATDRENYIITSILDHTSVLVLLLNSRGDIIWFNPALQSLTGHSVKEVQSQAFWDIFISEEQQHAIKNIFDRLVVGKTPINFRSFWKTRDDRTRLIEWSNAVLLNEDDDAEYIVCTGVDNTEQRRAEAEREQILMDLQHRTNQLKTAAAVSSSVVSILDPKELMHHTVNLIVDAFDFYYAGMFLVEDGDYAVLKAGTGEPGTAMLAQEHRLKVGGDSMIGQCIATGRARIALDVGQEAIRFDNPHLPLTRSELALPLISRGVCFGALTVQSSKEAAYSEEDVAILQTMVDQVAGAIENARLFEEAHREIEERKQAQRALEESRNLLSIIIDTLPTYFNVKDLDGRFIQLNKWSLNDFFENFEVEEILGKTDFDFFPEEIARQFRNDEIKVIETGEPIINKEELNTGLDGRSRWMLTTKAALRDASGKIIGTVGAAQEITRQKEAEMALREARDTLEERVHERTLQLEAANRELESFAYSVSHDLRAPLRAIDGFSQALMEDYSPVLDEDGLDYLQRVRKASQRMGQLIDDLLMLSRVTRSEIRKERVNLSAIAHEVVGELRQIEPERQVEFNIEDNLIVNGDARLLQIVLENLLSNAWKFTAQKYIPRIELGYNEESGEYFVRDNGVGFDMTYVDKLFGAFQRLHTDHEFEGTGIGLATVRRIIHRHGGSIRAEGHVGKGATFHFSF